MQFLLKKFYARQYNIIIIFRTLVSWIRYCNPALICVNTTQEAVVVMPKGSNTVVSKFTGSGTSLRQGRDDDDSRRKKRARFESTIDINLNYGIKNIVT